MNSIARTGLRNPEDRPHQRRRRTGLGFVIGTAVVLGALAQGPAALAVTSVPPTPSAPATSVPQWQIQDAVRPAVDTGSIRGVTNSRIDGFGNIFVRVSSTPEPRLNGEMMRGFGLTLTGDTFETTAAVELGAIDITREVRVDPTQNSARFFDTFTNTSDEPVTVDVSFGGSLGYGNPTTSTFSPITATASGDTTIGADDAWTLSATSATNQRPVGVVLGSPAPFAGALTSVGDQQLGPFDNAYDPTTNAASFYGYIHTVIVPAGETKSLARFVTVGAAAADSQPAEATRLAALALAPDFTGLDAAEICSLSNWDLALVPGVDAAACVPGALPIPDSPAVEQHFTTSSYDVVNKSIAELQADMVSGVTTSEQITQAYLDRISAYDGGQLGLNSFLHVSETALEQARTADAERAGGRTGDLLGVPIALKDLYDTKDMPTTGGTLALEGYQPTTDAFQVAKLREAGAVLIGKTNLSEFANSGSFSDSGYGQVWNVLYPSKTSFGSSGGSAVSVAASFTAAALGTQTGVSLYAPTTGSSLAAFRGTDGMASAAGVMPLSYIQDYAGPIARDVTDLASLLNATAGTNPADALTAEADTRKPADWKTALDTAALQGARIGYLPSAFGDAGVLTTEDDGTPEAALAKLSEFEAAGATLVRMPNAPTASRAPGGSLNAEGWARYIADQAAFPYADGNALLSSPLVLPYNLPSQPGTAQRMTPEQVTAYIQWRTDYKALIATWMDTNDVDAVVYPGFLSDVYNNDAASAALSSDRGTGVLTSTVGLPTVIVPVGVNDRGYSMSMQIVGRAWSDAEVLGMGFALEQQADAQITPTIVPALELLPGTEPPTTPTTPETPATPAEPAALPDNAGKVTLAATGTDAGSGMLSALALGALGAGVFALARIRRRTARR
ncbi:amidase family protein [Agreia sp. PsM10]|uniref:amidase n=1 Tax=Agreia sp. PsM10 TaxID=3030533 RepID=UPI00263B8473|nr:amidase family protein [Agreia sp. PsM10]MDN4640192.1 amidase family protein [Agreia sp. PsM10]